MSAVGAFYILARSNAAFGQTFVRIGVISGAIATVLLAFPTGDQQGKMIAFNQPVTLAAMEGLFNAENGAPLALIGQPDTDRGRLDNAIAIPKMLSFLTYQRWEAEIKGLNDFPRDQWPDNIPLLYFSYHIMVGLGTLLIAVTCPERDPAEVRPLVQQSRHAVGFDAGVSVPLHRNHRRLDDRRTRPAAVADLRIDADVGRHLRSRLGGQRRVHLARIPGLVCTARACCSSS